MRFPDYDESAGQRYAPVTFVRRIRGAIRQLEPDTLLELRCFNKEEADAVWDMLKPQEREKVARITWMVWR